MARVGRMRFGTLSWSKAEWAGVFYPTGLPKGGELARYATQFDTVEADATYYGVPAPTTTAGWAARTPPDFVLSAKFPHGIVHGGKSAQPDGSRVLVREHVGAELERFLEVMEALGPKCGPLVLQFPSFNRRAFASAEVFRARLEPFLEALPARFRYAVEVRNASWIDEELLALLRRRRCALALLDLGADMPHPAELARRFDLATTDFVYARLVGDRKHVAALAPRLDHVVLDQSDRLDAWSRLLHELRERVRDIYVYAGNHFAGFAPDTARDLARRVEALA